MLTRSHVQASAAPSIPWSSAYGFPTFSIPLSGALGQLEVCGASAGFSHPGKVSITGWAYVSGNIEITSPFTVYLKDGTVRRVEATDGVVDFILSGLDDIYDITCGTEVRYAYLGINNEKLGYTTSGEVVGYFDSSVGYQTYNADGTLSNDNNAAITPLLFDEVPSGQLSAVLGVVWSNANTLTKDFAEHQNSWFTDGTQGFYGNLPWTSNREMKDSNDEINYPREMGWYKGWAPLGVKQVITALDTMNTDATVGITAEGSLSSVPFDGMQVGIDDGQFQTEWGGADADSYIRFLSWWMGEHPHTEFLSSAPSSLKYFSVDRRTQERRFGLAGKGFDQTYGSTSFNTTIFVGQLQLSAMANSQVARPFGVSAEEDDNYWASMTDAINGYCFQDKVYVFRPTWSENLQLTGGIMELAVGFWDMNTGITGTSAFTNGNAVFRFPTGTQDFQRPVNNSFFLPVGSSGGQTLPYFFMNYFGYIHAVQANEFRVWTYGPLVNDLNTAGVTNSFIGTNYTLNRGGSGFGHTIYPSQNMGSLFNYTVNSGNPDVDWENDAYRFSEMSGGPMYRYDFAISDNVNADCLTYAFEGYTPGPGGKADTQAHWIDNIDENNVDYSALTVGAQLNDVILDVDTGGSSETYSSLSGYIHMGVELFQYGSNPVQTNNGDSTFIYYGDNGDGAIAQGYWRTTALGTYPITDLLPDNSTISHVGMRCYSRPTNVFYGNKSFRMGIGKGIHAYGAYFIPKQRNWVSEAPITYWQNFTITTDTAYNLYQVSWATDPWKGGAWTPEGINEIGHVGIHKNTGSHDSYKGQRTTYLAMEIGWYNWETSGNIIVDIDSGDGDYKKIAWTENTPGGTNITLNVSGSDDDTFGSYDDLGTVGQNYRVSGYDYYRVRGNLTGPGTNTPELKSIIISDGLPEPIPLPATATVADDMSPPVLFDKGGERLGITNETSASEFPNAISQAGYNHSQGQQWRTPLWTTQMWNDMASGKYDELPYHLQPTFEITYKTCGTSALKGYVHNFAYWDVGGGRRIAKVNLRMPATGVATSAGWYSHIVPFQGYNGPAGFFACENNTHNVDIYVVNQADFIYGWE